MPLDLEPIQQQTQFPLKKKPSLSPEDKDVYNDVFALQNTFRVLFFVLDGMFKKIQDYVNSGAGSSATLKLSVFLNTAVASHASSNWAKVPVDTVEFDTNNIWDSANRRAVPNKAGYYKVTARVRRNSNNTLVAGIAKNGALYKVIGVDGGSLYATGGDAIVYCNGTTDYIELVCFSNASIMYTTGTVDTYLNVIGPV